MKVQQQLQKLKNAVLRFQQQLMDAEPSPDGKTRALIMSH